MLTKLRISNEQEMVNELEGDSQMVYRLAFEKLCVKEEIESVVYTLLTVEYDGVRFLFNGFDPKTNTYFYKFESFDF